VNNEADEGGHVNCIYIQEDRDEGCDNGLSG